MFEEKELEELKEFMDSLGANLPENKMGMVWNAYKKIAKSQEAQPCSCQSAARLWINALNVIKNYLTELNNEQR